MTTTLTVETGSTWQVGNHIFHTGDLMNGAAPNYDFDIVYADPPWNASQLSRFRHMADLPSPTYDLDAIYRRILELAGAKPVYLETSIKYGPVLYETLPGPHTAIWDIVYYRTKPAMIVYNGPQPSKAILTGLDEERATIVAALNSHLRGVVYDPVSGTGLTAAAAEAVGWRSVNNELNPARTTKALNRLALVTGYEPRRID